jgi:DNA-binding response OmpR family regulator
VLLVEFRDEVFARVERDLHAARIRVVRAESMQDADRQCRQGTTDLVIVNVDRTDEASWLRARQLRRRFPNVEIWVVTAWASSVDATLVLFVGATQLIYYADLWRLADEIRRRVDGDDGPCEASPRLSGSDPSSRSAA